MRVIPRIWRDLTTPEDFRDDWYGWVTNKISHIALGFMLAAVPSAIWLSGNGEFPQKAWLWPLIALAVAAFQIGAQGWNGWDTIEDWTFIAVFGAGQTVAVFTQFYPQDGILTVSIWHGLPFWAIITAWLVAGAWQRISENVDEVE